MGGRLQNEGEVVHVTIDRIVDEGDLLRRVGEMSFPHRTGDSARHSGAPDRGDAGVEADRQERLLAAARRQHGSRGCGARQDARLPLIRAARVAPPGPHRDAVGRRLPRRVRPSGERRVDTVVLPLALNWLVHHCPERWPLDLFLGSAGQDNDIGRAQGVTAAFNGIVRQLRHSKGCEG